MSNRHFATSAGITHEITRASNGYRVTRCLVLILSTTPRAIAYLDENRVQQTKPGEPCKRCFWKHDLDYKHES